MQTFPCPYLKVVVSEAAPTERSWIVTAYVTRRLINGEIEWQKS